MAVIGASNSLGGISGSNAVARLLVVISGDSTPLTTALAKSEAGIGGLSKNASSIGNALTRNLSLPLLALGGYAIHAASDFETALGKIAGLTPFLDQTGRSIDSVAKQLLTIASDPKVIAGPTELANSLFLAGSAGLKASQAIDVVKLSAQGMSAGMGTAVDISKVLIAALNNYRSTGLTAAHAMDVLTVAIREGTAAPDEMAIALGRLLPVAAAAGVTFEQVTASVAALTNLGVPTRVATTSLRALFSELLAPTAAATKRLDEFGISAAQLRDTLANNGPIAAFALLQRAVHGNVDALHDIIPQIRGFTAYLGLTGTNAKSYSHIIQEANHATGAFGKALDIVAKTPEFQFQKGLQELQIAAIKVGEDLLPLFIAVAKVFQNLGSVIGNLSGPLTAALAGFIALGAVIGPVVKLYGTLTQLKAATLAENAAMTATVPTMKALTTGMVAFSIAAIVGIGGLQSLARGAGSVIAVASALIGIFVAVKLALEGMFLAVNAGILGTNALSLALAGLSGGAITGIALGIAAVVTVVTLLAGAASTAQRSTDQMSAAFLTAAKNGDTLGAALKSIKDDTVRKTLTETARAAGILGEKAGVAFNQLSKGLGVRLIADLNKLTASSTSFVQSLGGTAEATRFVQVLKDAIASGKDLGKALKEAGFSSDQFFAAISSAQQATRTGGVAMTATAQDAQLLALEIGKLMQANRDYQAAQLATIGGHIAEGNAIQALAARSGVSVDFITQKLNEFGVSAAGMTRSMQDTFLTAAAGVDKFGNKITLKATEMEKAAADMAQKISDSLSQGFDLFGDKLPKAVTNLDAIIKKAQQFGAVAVQQAANVRTLLERGVPTGLIDQFIAKGPAMVAAFAGATTPQLNKVVNAYDLALGAMDAKILEEAVHQEGKGKSMVQNFATAILSANNLLRGAGVKIVAAVASGLNAGTIKPPALALISQFVRTLNSAKGITRAAGTQAAIAFANGIASGDYVGPKGKILVQQAARGIAANSPLTVKEAKALVQRVANGMTSDKEKTKAAGLLLADNAITGVRQGSKGADNIGRKFVADFANGMLGATNLVDAAAKAIVARAKASFDAALKNSPYYFTLPMGRKLITDLYEGAKEESNKSKGPNEAAANVYRQFHKSFLNQTSHFQDILGKLQTLVKDNIKKAFDAGDLEMVKSLEAMGKHLTDRLTKLQTKFVDFRHGIRDAFMGFKDFGSIITTAWSDYQQQLKDFGDAMIQYQKDLADFQAGGSTGTAPVAPTAPIAPDFSGLIQQQVADAQRLAKDLLKAQRLGLNRTLLTQFAGQGAAGANALEELFKNPELIQSLNNSFDTINKVLGHTVDKLGDAYFGRALDFAVNALLKFAEGVTKLIKELLAGLGDTNKKLIASLNQLLSSISNFHLPSPPAGTPTGTPGGGTGGGGGGMGGGGTGSPWDTGWSHHTPGTTPPILHRSFVASTPQTVVNETHVHFHEPVVGNHEAFVRQIDEGLSKQRRANGQLALDKRG